MAESLHDVVIIGAGQAGLALSWFLCRAGVGHVVLEKGRIGNAWRANRWDSFCLVTPNWSITLPGAEYDGGNTDGFMPRDEFVRHLEAWATGFAAPAREGVTALSVSREGDRHRVETDQGTFHARHLVVATATYQVPRATPWMSGLSPDFHRLTTADYRNPDTLPPGGVLVVGSGQSGCQIAQELNRAGRDVVLSLGRCGRLPRRYRGRDCITWQRDMGLLDRTPDMLETPAHRFRPDPQLTGARGGETLSLHDLAAEGVTLVGRVAGINGDIARFADDADAAVTFADNYARDFRASVDDFILRHGLEAPAACEADMAGEPPPGGTRLEAITKLDLRARGISTILSATGFTHDFSWVKYPVFDDAGYPITDRGSTTVPGLHFMGLNWMHKRKSGIIHGVAEDAEFLAGRIVEQLS